MKIPFFDRTRADQAQLPELQQAFARVVQSGHYILGAEVQRLEQSIAEYLQIPHAVAMSSCSDALLCAMLALGVQPGDEIICPAYSFFATAGSIARLHARPVFADIDAETFSIDPQKAAQRIGPNTKGMIAVHLFGMPANLIKLKRLADEHGLWLIEDAAQALGTSVDMGEGLGMKAAGTVGTAGCFSFFPTKNLGGFGDGGLLVANDIELAVRARKLRAHGSAAKHHHEMLGGNFRMDALQAALLGEKQKHLTKSLLRRRAIAAQYDQFFIQSGLAAPPGGDREKYPIELGARPAGHSFNQYVIRVLKGKRDWVRSHLGERGVGTEIYYPKPIHIQPVFEGLGYREGDMPEAERACRETLALPIFPELFDSEVRYVMEQIQSAF